MRSASPKLDIIRLYANHNSVIQFGAVSPRALRGGRVGVAKERSFDKNGRSFQLMERFLLNLDLFCRSLCYISGLRVIFLQDVER
jgi:hypothetical protein